MKYKFLTTSVLVIRQWIKQFWNFLLQFAELQLFLTIFSFPILLMWGLPISLLSPLGNLIFGPVITLFLALSSLIFFFELFSFPNTFLIKILEKVTSWWLYLMPADTRYLIAFPQPSWAFVVLVLLLLFYILHTKSSDKPYRTVILLALLLMGASLFLKITTCFESRYLKVPCNKGHVVAVADRGSLMVIDPGFIGDRVSAPTWVQYTLMPELIKKTGCSVIDALILMKPSGFTFQAATRLCLIATVKKIYFPYWEGVMSKYGLAMYRALKAICQQKGISLVRIGKEHSVVFRGDTLKPFQIQRLSGTLVSGPIKYPAFAVSTQIDNQEITIYSARYKQKAH